MLFLVAAMAAEMERDFICERTHEGLDAARAGRPAKVTKVTKDVLAEVVSRLYFRDSVVQDSGTGPSPLRDYEHDRLLAASARISARPVSRRN
jgi:hypothetical protein